MVIKYGTLRYVHKFEDNDSIHKFSWYDANFVHVFKLLQLSSHLYSHGIAHKLTQTNTDIVHKRRPTRKTLSSHLIQKCNYTLTIDSGLIALNWHLRLNWHFRKFVHTYELNVNRVAYKQKSMYKSQVFHGMPGAFSQLISTRSYTIDNKVHYAKYRKSASFSCHGNIN